MTAIVAIVSALIGAAGAGIPALVVANSQIDNANTRADIDFLRTQRQALYASFLQKDDAVSDAEDAVLEKAYYQGVDARAEIARADALLTDMINQEQRFEVISTYEGLEAAENLISVHSDVQQNLRWLEDGRAGKLVFGTSASPSIQSLEQSREDVRSEIDYNLDALPDVRSMFTEFARSDLGVAPLYDGAPR